MRLVLLVVALVLASGLPMAGCSMTAKSEKTADTHVQLAKDTQLDANKTQVFNFQRDEGPVTLWSDRTITTPDGKSIHETRVLQHAPVAVTAQLTKDAQVEKKGQTTLDKVGKVVTVEATTSKAGLSWAVRIAILLGSLVALFAAFKICFPAAAKVADNIVATEAARIGPPKT